MKKNILVILCAVLSCMTTRAQEILNMELISQTALNSIGNDIWGYVDSTGREYAIAGTRANTQIYDISDPVRPELLYTVPGLRSSIWRDYKSYGSYIYGVADQGTEGVTIIDMTLAPDSISYTRWTDTLALSGTDEVINTCHNVYLDEKGRLYLAGCNVGNQGVLIYDITQTPTAPQLVGVQDDRYSHDVINIGDTMYSSEIYEGNLAVYDMSDMSDIKLLAREQTSSTFTHNAWPSDDGRYIYTTDETGNGNLDAYDISDLDNIQRLDTYRPKDNASIVPHNAHYLDGHLITSWYTEGIVVVDGSRPHNLVRVAQYDTNPQDRNGCWGAYPYLPSGLIIATDMDNGLYILRSSHQRAAFVEGIVSDATSGTTINNATITLVTDGTTISDDSDAQGAFSTGVPYTGEGTLSIIANGYEPYLDTISIVEGEVTMIDARLISSQKYTLSGTITDDQNSALSGVQVSAISETGEYITKTDTDGQYQIEAVSGDYTIYFAKWGYQHATTVISLDQALSRSTTLTKGHQDDFFADLGWTVEGNATMGKWTRTIPKATTLGDSQSNPGADASDDLGQMCYVTGNNSSSVGADDVDDGSTTLISPTIDLSSYERAEISLSYWFFNGGGSGTPNDHMTIDILLDNGNRKNILTLDQSASDSKWRDLSFYPTDSIDATSIRISITVTDDRPGHIVEGGVDAFSIVERGNTTSTIDIAQDVFDVIVYPNPTKDILYLSTAEGVNLEIIYLYSAVGELMMKSSDTSLDISHLPDGLYLLSLQSDQGHIIQKEIIKIK